MSPLNTRRGHRKLRPLQSMELPVVQQPRLLKQKKLKWQRLRRRALKLGRMGYPVRHQSKDEELVTPHPFRKVQQNYKKNHQAVQELKLFYGNLKDRQLMTLLKTTGSAYRNRVRSSGAGKNASQRRALILEGSLIRALESRLSVALWRRFLVPTMEARQQVVSHGHVSVNGKVIRKQSYKLRTGDVVKLNLALVDKFAKVELDRSDVWKQLSYRCPPPHLEVSVRRGKFIFVHAPYGREVRFPFNLDINRVRSFYR